MQPGTSGDFFQNLEPTYPRKLEIQQEDRRNWSSPGRLPLGILQEC